VLRKAFVIRVLLRFAREVGREFVFPARKLGRELAGKFSSSAVKPRCDIIIMRYIIGKTARRNMGPGAPVAKAKKVKGRPSDRKSAPVAGAYLCYLPRKA
jgi:hypothetical protein